MGFLGLIAVCLPLAHSQTTVNRARAVPKLEPVADTKLLMQGLAEPNLRSLGKLLRDKPKDAEAWTFARGQALLIAETGNLLLLRPRAGATYDTWMQQSGELRDSASALARALAARDYARSRTALAAVANICNHCHQAAQVQTRVNPFGDE
jgi:hypothetical protein